VGTRVKISFGPQKGETKTGSRVRLVRMPYGSVARAVIISAIVLAAALVAWISISLSALSK
jgi:hypothetical protein